MVILNMIRTYQQQLDLKRTLKDKNKRIFTIGGKPDLVVEFKTEGSYGILDFKTTGEY